MTDFASIQPKAVSAMNAAQLLNLFNECAVFVGAPPCKRFASLKVGYTRTVNMLKQAVDRQKEVGLIAADPIIEPKTVTKEAIAQKIKKEPKAAIAKEQVRGTKTWTLPEDGSCPRCGGSESDITPAGEEGTAAAHRNHCHHCQLEWDPETGKEYKKPVASAERSAKISQSWTNAQTAAARKERHGVTVSGKGIKGTQSFDSVRKAFLALGLPMSKHIKFRGDLKKAGTLDFEGYKFTAVQKAK